MPNETDRIVNGLLRRWQRRFPMVQGRRNPNIFNLAAELNNYGIPCTRALEECLRYADPTGPDPFTDREITRTVKSAYRSTAHAIKKWGGGHGGHAPRPSFTPRLTPAQTKAVEDKLAEEFRARFAWKPWGMEPQQHPAEVGTMAAPAPPPQPITSAPPIVKSRAEVAIERMAAKNPEINLLVDLLQLDVAGATVRNLKRP
ncbi:MAG TPA: primase C-terminal domain-containing protein [Flavobacteriales bacterium]|nr:primase C-terminal domain-containing protein [Flavobacteriales bacterium]HRP82779.1 primase C-terminal domain-containing protein [Flavobacteriales bacterium]